MFRKTIVFLFILYICNNSYSQNCNNCNNNNIINGDFEEFDPTCVSNSSNYGSAFFNSNCVDNWSAAFQSPDLITPSVSFVNLAPLIPSSMAGMLVPGFESIISNSFNFDIINSPEFNYSLNFDLAAANIVIIGPDRFNNPLLDVYPSTLDVSLVSGNTVDLVQSIPITNNDNITFGINSHCLDPIPLVQGTYSQIQFQPYKNTPWVTGDPSCWALIDNVNMN